MVRVIDVPLTHEANGRVEGHDHVGSRPTNLTSDGPAQWEAHLQAAVDEVEELDIHDSQSIGRVAHLALADLRDRLATPVGPVPTRGPIGGTDVADLGPFGHPFRYGPAAEEFGVVGMREYHECPFELHRSQRIGTAT
jgi:hypothetical protein